jgi:ABC-type oligopeptide transport system substrate-binding subunit
VLPLRTFALNVDPATLADVDSRKVATLLHSGLVAIDQNGRVVPRVASSWRRTSPDTWEFRIRPSLTFSSGRPASPQAVVRSLCASLQPTSTQAWSLAGIAHETGRDKKTVNCTGLSVKGDNVVIREAQPSPWLLEGLAGPGGWIVDPDAPVAAYGNRPGLGPYVISRVRQDQDVELTPRPGGAVEPAVSRIIFRYFPDNSVAAAAFNSGGLDLLEVESPDLQALLTTAGELKRRGAQLLRANSDRVRIVTLNFARLQALQLSPDEAQAFRQLYSSMAPRQRIAAASSGLARPLLTSFPPADDPPRVSTPALAGRHRARELRLISENDSWSDRIAATLPTEVAGLRIRYTTLEKSLFLKALLSGDYDLALLKLEATHHTPRFWAAFFTPGNPYTVFGRPLRGFDRYDLSTAPGINEAARRVDAEGNWVPLVRDIGVIAMSPRLQGVRLTSTGQLSFEQVTLK